MLSCPISFHFPKLHGFQTSMFPTYAFYKSQNAKNENAKLFCEMGSRFSKPHRIILILWNAEIYELWILETSKLFVCSPNKDGSQGRGSYFASKVIPLEIAKARRRPWYLSLMAHDSRLMAHPLSHEPCGMSHEPWAMSHEPLTINNQLFDEFSARISGAPAPILPEPMMQAHSFSNAWWAPGDMRDAWLISVSQSSIYLKG